LQRKKLSRGLKVVAQGLSEAENVGAAAEQFRQPAEGGNLEMAIPHAKPAEVTDRLEVIRLVLPAGKEIKRHNVPGEITVQCLEGNVVCSTEQSECELSAGNLLYLSGSDDHALRAVEDASLLVTILLERNQPKA
jgi:quercetin dioxygenase-like cupin family protein